MTQSPAFEYSRLEPLVCREISFNRTCKAARYNQYWRHRFALTPAALQASIVKPTMAVRTTNSTVRNRRFADCFRHASNISRNSKRSFIPWRFLCSDKIEVSEPRDMKIKTNPSCDGFKVRLCLRLFRFRPVLKRYAQRYQPRACTSHPSFFRQRTPNRQTH